MGAGVQRCIGAWVPWAHGHVWHMHLRSRYDRGRPVRSTHAEPHCPTLIVLSREADAKVLVSLGLKQIYTRSKGENRTDQFRVRLQGQKLHWGKMHGLHER